jgi:ribosomal protein L11 methyltransferase
MGDAADAADVRARYPFVAVDATPEEADGVAAALFELGATGVEERDGSTLVRGASTGKVTLVGSYDSHEAAEAAIEALLEVLPEGAARLEEVVGDAWRDAWKEHFAPFALTPHITVVPPWAIEALAEGPDAGARAESPGGSMVLVLEPGRAFGTGLHPSTSLIAGVLDASRAELAGRELLDMGTGSGILSLVALRYGAARAVAMDIDPDVIEVVRENAARNGLADSVEASAGTVASVTRAFPWVLANIEARVLGPIAAELAALVAPGGTLVLSGILESEHDAMITRYTSLAGGRLTHASTSRRGEAAGEAWVAIVFTSA